MLKIKLENESWRPDRSSVIPLFKQIYDFITSRISSGEWSIGSRLPTQLKMAEVFGVNRSTVLEVYDQLKAEGLVESKKSLGTVIINNTWSLLTSSAPPDWGKKITESIHRPNLDIIKIINDTETEKNLIRLGAGELGREMMPSQYMKEVLSSLQNNVSYMGYDEPKGLLPLREEIVTYLGKRGIKTSASKIMIVSGALQALHLISMGLLHRGSVILTEKPSYIQSLTLFDSHKINLSGVEMDTEGIRPDSLISRIVTKKPELLYTIPDYHNPTGILMSEKRRIELLSLCEKERLPIIEDSVYGELWYDNPPPRPLKSFDKNGTVLYLGSISKTLSAGMRIGWIVGNENVIDRLADIKMQTDYGSSNISQWMCYEFLKSGNYEQFTSSLRRELKQKRDCTLHNLESHFRDLAEWKTPSGGLYIWLKLNRNISPYKLFETCYKQGIVINPGILYDSSDSRSLRISFSYAPEKELETGLKQLAYIIQHSKTE